MVFQCFFCLKSLHSWEYCDNLLECCVRLLVCFSTKKILLLSPGVFSLLIFSFSSNDDIKKTVVNTLLMGVTELSLFSIFFSSLSLFFSLFISQFFSLFSFPSLSFLFCVILWFGAGTHRCAECASSQFASLNFVPFFPCDCTWNVQWKFFFIFFLNSLCVGFV